jgi:hypothetical protein
MVFTAERKNILTQRYAELRKAEINEVGKARTEDTAGTVGPNAYCEV